ncbi:MAG: ankyrin repeat domain-containing protein, partial [Spartobacteria bacterium]|nr:ankyrin repeat domain-containing protein [Spartobacteria bacterium]
MAAAKGGHLEIVRFLLERGADVNARNEYGKTPLCLAALDHRDDVVACLQQRGGTT